MVESEKGRLEENGEVVGEDVEEMMEVDVAIAGAGMAGLSLAVGLRERGIIAHVFEKSAELLVDTATGISIGPNGTNALDGIKPGLSLTMRSAGSDIKSTKVAFFSGGKEVRAQTRNVENGELFVVRWKRARQILADLIPQDQIHLSHRFLTYKPVGDWIEALFDIRGDNRNNYGRRKRVRAKLLVGADGIRSAIRKILVGDEPRDLQLVNWNALIYNPESRLIKAHEKDQIVHMTALDSGTKAYLVDAGEGYTFWVFRVEDHKEDGTEGGFSKTGAKERALQELSKFQPSEYWSTLMSTIQVTDANLIFERRICDLLPLESWTDGTGRVLLIGDAAHAMYWGPGEGARTAFEDAHQLSDLLGDAIGSGGEEKIIEATKRFEQLRVPRLRKFQEFAAETTNLPALKPAWVKELSPEDARKRFEEFRRWACSYPNKMTGDPDSKYWK